MRSCTQANQVQRPCQVAMYSFSPTGLWFCAQDENSALTTVDLLDTRSRSPLARDKQMRATGLELHLNSLLRPQMNPSRRDLTLLRRNIRASHQLTDPPLKLGHSSSLAPHE
uniref:Uncharacterized protein n=1 Tax=Arundo donax TaxID=35708 RepID=A0A0A9D831_ARUDO